jgi:hypothetical protein
MLNLRQIIVERSVSPVRRDRASDIFDGNIVPTQMMGDYANEVQRFGMIRVDLKNLPVNRLGILKTTALVVLHGNRHCFGNRHGERKEGESAIGTKPFRSLKEPSLPERSRPEPGERKLAWRRFHEAPTDRNAISTRRSQDSLMAGSRHPRLFPPSSSPTPLPDPRVHAAFVPETAAPFTLVPRIPPRGRSAPHFHFHSLFFIRAVKIEILRRKSLSYSHL